MQLCFPPVAMFSGRVGVQEFVDELDRRLPELTMVANRTYTGADFAIVEWDASGESSDRRRVEELGCPVLQLQDGRLARAWLYCDTETWSRLAVPPLP